MKGKQAKKFLAVILAFAMIITGTSASMISNQIASAAKKAKVTLKLSKTKLSLQKGQKKTLKITKKKVKKIKSQKWTTSKKRVVTVSKKGKVTAKKAGKATIKCKVKYIAKGSKKVKSKTLKCTVTVKKTTVTKAPTATQKPVTSATPIPTGRGPEAPGYEKYDDKSNIGDAREVTIVGGTSEKMVVKDNGTMRKELSSQNLADSYMGLGINLGNTMEAQLTLAKKAEATEATDFEKAWGQPITTQEYIDCVHSYGINTLRIPVAWSNMINETTYEINEKYLGRVEEITNYALNNGMYVIINIHWDNQWWGLFGACKRLEDNSRVADETKRASAWTRFEKYWLQISERFKNYSDHLIFEGANEEIGSRLNDAIYKNGYSVADDPTDTTPVSGNLTKAQLYETANAINQKFVDIVRGTGGNNKYRHLLIPGFNTNIANTANSRFQMPKDISENGKTKLFLSVHYYDPWGFCGDKATGSYTDADRAAVAGKFAPLGRFTNDGYAVILGECGVVNPTEVDGDVIQWYKDTYSEARYYHMVPVMWEIGQYFDRAAAKLKFKDMAKLWNELTGAKGDTSMSKLTGKNNVPAVETVSAADKKAVWSWTGKWYKNGGDNIVGDDRYQEKGGTLVSLSSTDAEALSMFVPASQMTPAIDGDTTSISFNPWGYQAFLKLDVSKYKKPAISFEFMEGTNNAENVGTLSFCASAEEKHSDEFSVDYSDFNGKAVVLGDAVGLSAEKPYLAISFSSKPTVTAIHIYETGE